MLSAKKERNPNVYRETLFDIENRSNMVRPLLFIRGSKTSNMAGNPLKDWWIRWKLKKSGKIESVLGR